MCYLNFLEDIGIAEFRETKDTVRVSLQEYLFTGSSKGYFLWIFGRKEYGYRTSWRGVWQYSMNLPQQYSCFCLKISLQNDARKLLKISFRKTFVERVEMLDSVRNIVRLCGTSWPAWPFRPLLAVNQWKPKRTAGRAQNNVTTFQQINVTTSMRQKAT